MKLLTSFHLQTNGQNEQMNQELEQYLWFFVDHRQNEWLEWLVMAEFAINNKTYSVTKISLFIANYGRELRMETAIRRKDIESDEVYKKNEDSRKSKSSIKKSTREDEETSREVEEEGQGNVEYK